MRKYMITFILLCLHGLARGQTEDYNCYYWFDDDRTSLRMAASTSNRWQLVADVSGLSESLHTIHLLVRDGEGRQSNPTMQLFMHTKEVSEQTTAYYWFDNKQGEPHTSPMVQGSFDVDASNLDDGIHTFHYLVTRKDGNISSPTTCYFLKATSTVSSGQPTCICMVDGKQVYRELLPADGGAIHWDFDASNLDDGLHVLQVVAMTDNGSLSSSYHSYFVKMPEADTTIKGYYWFDDENDVHETTLINGTFEVDASLLSDGFHRFYYQAKYNDGATSTPSTNYFLKTAQVNADDELNCICTVDGQLRHIEKLSQQGGVIHWNLDMQDLTDGLHRIQLQAVTPSGALSSSYMSYFMRVTSSDELGEMRFIYAIDNNPFSSDANVVSDGGNYHFDIDLTELEEGLHYISCMLYNDHGTNTKVQTRFFLKVPLGGNGISWYQYWLNDEGIDTAKSVILPQKMNPLQLMSLLPVGARPLRSSAFHFDTSSGKPMVYARNTIYLRFYDAAMRFTDVTKDYADYNVSQEVNVIKTLESGVSEATVWPEENEIKWYQVTAERGDSLRFKLNHPATLQLFAPSSKEVYNVSGSESVKWGGLHAAESGTFYVALHDVTATQGEDICIDYEHIDKYAVLRQDVAVVGNGGCSTITFEGNGFRDLYAVDLYNEQGDSIKHIHIGYESDATTSVAFDFTGATLGDYHAKFHFTEEDKVFTKLVTVEDAVDIELATTVTYPSMFLRGTSTTYTIKITNRGNMTAYAVPVHTYIRSKTVEGVNHIKYNGLNLSSYAETVGIDDFTDEDKKVILDFSESLSDDWYFTKMKVGDENNPGDSIIIRSNYFFVDIAPNSEKVLGLTVFTTEDGVFAYFTIPQKWITLTGSSETLSRSLIDKFSVNENTNSYCCIKEGVECFADMIAFRFDVASVVISAVSVVQPELAPIAATVSWVDCGVSIANTALKAIGDYVCNADEELTKYKIITIAKNQLQSAIGASLSCLSGKLNGLKGAIASLGGATVSNIKVGQIIKSISTKLFQITPIGDILGTINCIKKITNPDPCCTGECGGGGGTSVSVITMDPNDIYGYTAESMSKAVMDGQTDVYYRIEFENDPEFATAAAHDIYVIDTLDATKFDLSTFTPTRIVIGDKSAELTGEKDFITTIDMRPNINAIAQVEGTFDEQKGIAKWHISSLDPMTMEPTTYVMDGVLPVNTNGQGIGEVSYDIKLKDGLAHGTEVNNRASIVFDTNEPIMTPTWTNVIDRIAPESHVTDVKMLNDSTAAVSIEATDELSGPWRYDVYVQYGTGSAWVKMAENVSIDTTASVKVYEGINHGFYVVVTDSAGNVEQKEAAREYTFEVFAPQVDTNTKLQLAQGWNWVSHNQQEALGAEVLKPKAQRIVSQTDELYKDSRFGWTGTLDELLPTQMYKVQMAEADEVQLSGRLFNAAFRAVPLYAGWNWIGYPVAQTMTPAEALQKMEAEEDDAIIGRDGLATYSDGEWTGTLAEMMPGQGYMYRSASDKSLFLNATAQASSRAVHRSRSMADGQWPENWTVDRQRYPNVMGMVAELWQDGKPVEDSGEWLLGAFSGGECRGLAETVGNHLMMNVYGRGGEKIEFFVMHRESGEILPVSESEEFRADLLGTVRQPYRLNMGVLTGIRDVGNRTDEAKGDVYDLQGRRISVSSASSENSVLPKGVYIVTDGQKKGTQKVVRK